VGVKKNRVKCETRKVKGGIMGKFNNKGMHQCRLWQKILLGRAVSSSQSSICGIPQAIVETSVPDEYG
jgi:hypothetical protein